MSWRRWCDGGECNEESEAKAEAKAEAEGWDGFVNEPVVDSIHEPVDWACWGLHKKNKGKTFSLLF